MLSNTSREAWPKVQVPVPASKVLEISGSVYIWPLVLPVGLPSVASSTKFFWQLWEIGEGLPAMLLAK